MEKTGMVNRYVCEKCQRAWVTINLNTGVTPFIIGCRGCEGGMASSSMYRLPAGELQVTLAWYRPILDEFRRLSTEEQEHVMNGGLLLGEFGKVVAILEDAHVAKLFAGGDRDGWLQFVASTYDPDTKIFQKLVERYKRIGTACE